MIWGFKKYVNISITDTFLVNMYIFAVKIVRKTISKTLIFKGCVPKFSGKPLY